MNTTTERHGKCGHPGCVNEVHEYGFGWAHVGRTPFGRLGWDHEPEPVEASK